MKKVVLCLWLTACSVYGFSQTIHAIIIANTYDSSIGSGCLEDKDLMFKQVTTANGALHYKLKQYIFEDNQFFDKRGVLSTLNSLSCSPNDVVFFYFTGHGARGKNDATKWPQLSFNKEGENVASNYLPLWDVYQTILKKDPRLALVFADCCNTSSTTQYSKLVSKGQATVADSESKLEAVYKKLFHSAKGSVIASSSTPGQASIALEDQGSLFTISYDEMMSNVLKEKIDTDWETLLGHIKEQTIRFAKDINETQIPQFEVNLSSNPKPLPTPDLNDPMVLINSLVDYDKSANERIKLMSIVKKQAFINSNAVIETYGRDYKTLVERETASEFVRRMATSSTVVKIIKMEGEGNNNKFSKLKIHEIVKL